MFIVKCRYFTHWGEPVHNNLMVCDTVQQAEEAVARFESMDDKSNRGSFYEYENIGTEVDPVNLPDSSLLLYNHRLPRLLNYIFGEIYRNALIAKTRDLSFHNGYDFTRFNKIERSGSLEAKEMILRKYIMDAWTGVHKDRNIDSLSRLYNSDEVISMLYPLLEKRHAEYTMEKSV